MSMAHACALIDADNRYAAKIDTWGHMAPSKNVKYPIHFVAAVGFFDCLNPVLLTCGPDDGPWDGPWFYDAVNEFISDRIGKDENSGKIFSFEGHWRNYRFVGKFSQIKSRTFQA